MRKSIFFLTYLLLVIFYRLDALPATPTNSVKALKATNNIVKNMGRMVEVGTG